MKSSLKVPPELAKFLKELPPPIKRKIRGGLDAILEDPHAGKPLRAELAGLWSLPVGRFRIIYRVQETWIDIVAVGPRSRIYQQVTLSLAAAR